MKDMIEILNWFGGWGLFWLFIGLIVLFKD